MRNTFVITLLLTAAAVHGQEAAVYRMNFALHETEGGKSQGARNFAMTVVPREFQKLNIGTKVPVQSSSGSITYVDVGVSVRARIQESGPQLLMSVELEVSGLGAERESGRAPRIEQLKASIDTAIPVEKPVRVVTLDDPAGPRHYELEVTASKVR